MLPLCDRLGLECRHICSAELYATMVETSCSARSAAGKQFFVCIFSRLLHVQISLLAFNFWWGFTTFPLCKGTFPLNVLLCRAYSSRFFQEISLDQKSLFNARGVDLVYFVFNARNNFSLLFFCDSCTALLHYAKFLCLLPYETSVFFAPIPRFQTTIC